MVIKVENLVPPEDSFSLPYNPTVFDDSLTNNYKITPLDYRKYHILNTGGGISPLSLVLTGHFSGASKRTNYRSLRKHFQETLLLKKLYFESDKFYLGVGRGIKQVNAGGRTNFIDYVANFEALVGILFGDTEKTTGTNAGDVTTYVMEVTGTVHDGAVNITISDGLGNVVTIPASALTTNLHIIYLFIKLVHSGGGVYTTRHAYFGIEVDSGTTSSTTAYKLIQSGQHFDVDVTVGDMVINTTDSTRADVTKVDNATTLSLSRDIMVSGEAFVIYHQSNQVRMTNEGIPQVRPGANITSVTETNIDTQVFKFRDGWSG